MGGAAYTGPPLADKASGQTRRSDHDRPDRRRRQRRTRGRRRAQAISHARRQAGPALGGGVADPPSGHANRARRDRRGSASQRGGSARMASMSANSSSAVPSALIQCGRALPRSAATPCWSTMPRAPSARRQSSTGCSPPRILRRRRAGPPRRRHLGAGRRYARRSGRPNRPRARADAPGLPSGRA